MKAQLYCTIGELIDDLGLPGDEHQLFERIKAASDFIQRRFGDFIPVTATKKFGTRGSEDLQVDPLLAVTSITNGGITVSDYDLYPLNRHWENGPYTRIYQDNVWDDTNVQIAGQWGKYIENQSLGLTGTQAAADTATVTVTNGSLLSPGMVLLLESEQELVTGFGTPSAATSKLNGALAIDQEEATVDNGTEFFEKEVIRLSTEDCRIRMIVGNVLVLDRGWNRTTRKAHLDDAAISVFRTFTTERGVNGTTAAAHSNKSISRCMVPWDVNWLCRQIAGLMRMKAASGFSGKVGNVDTGETFYQNEFPDLIKKIERNYRITSL